MTNNDRILSSGSSSGHAASLFRDLAAGYKAELSKKSKTHFNARRRWKASLAILHAYCRDVDKILREIYNKCIDTERTDAAFCLIALGGYGRKELWPYSDVDILILHQNQHKSAKLSRAIKLFWNIGLTMGCVVRTVSECISIIGDDLATDTAMLESRYVCGNRDLFHQLQNNCIKPYFAKNKKKYIDEISAALHDGLYSSENSLYRVEPNIKNGICTLRDCQRLLWAERVRCNARKFKDLHIKSGFSLTETKRFEANYSFLASLRMEMHLIYGQRMDVLEMDYQNIIAERCGFGEGGAGRLMEAFYKTVRDIRLSLLSFLEKDLSGKSIWRDVRRRLSAMELAPGIATLDGIIFPRHKREMNLHSAEAIIQLFKSALAYQATLSVELRNIIRQAVAGIDTEDFKSKVAGDVFLEILSWPARIGQVLLIMQETGILGKLIPPFDMMACKVEYDQYHEFTLDQHTLLALCACDELENDDEAKISCISKSIGNKLVLRLAVLLHDIGKIQPGDHSQNGSIIAENICERLGLNEEQTDQVRFLIYHHLDLSNISLLREPDDHDIAQFAGNIPSRNTLDLLYLLTIVDIRSVGPRTWTGWKAYQLEQLYDRVIRFLDHHKTDGEEVGAVVAAVIPDKSYWRDNPPEDREKHRQWLAQIGETQLGLHNELFAGFERLTVCASDRVGFLSDIIGCISSEGYNILSARIYSTPDDKVLDIFHLEPPEKPRLTAQKRIAKINRKWEMIESRQATADDLVAERIKLYPLPSLRSMQQELTVDINIINADSQRCTIIEIDTADNFGLLHKIAHCFYENRVNIVSARLSTRNDRAVDAFYVTDAAKRKIIDQYAINCLVAALTHALKTY
jgi:[protein-PII] uridylyltransferase